jgi:hypothetical protein
MPETMCKSSSTVTVSGLGATAGEELCRMRLRADLCRNIAIAMVGDAKSALDRDDPEAASACRSLHDVELTRSAIYDVGAVLLEELQGITAILEKHKLGGLRPTESPPTV